MSFHTGGHPSHHNAGYKVETDNMAQRPTSWAPSPSYGPPRPEGAYTYGPEQTRPPALTSMNPQYGSAMREHQPEYYQPEYQQAQYYRQDYHHHQYQQQQQPPPPPPHEFHQPPSPVYHQPPQYHQHQAPPPPPPRQPAQLTDPYRTAPMHRYLQEPPRESPTTAPGGEPYDQYQAAREAHLLKRDQPPPMPYVTQGAPRMLNDTYEGKVAIPFTPPSLRIPAQRAGSAMLTRGASWSADSQPDRLKIEDLLSGGGSDLMAIQCAPGPEVKPVPNEYEIFFRQQPKAARCCGYGERDRRVIDPPPIVQLRINNPDLTPDEVYQRIRHPAYVVHCTIWDQFGKADMTNMPDDVLRPGKRLMGSLVSSPFVGQDENGQEGCFFCFPDMSVRTPGLFRLKFALVVVDPMHRSPRAPIKCNILSDVFQVFNAKDFPGMQASTPLTKRLKEQGCLISIKKGNDKSGAKNARQQDDSGDEDEEEETTTPKRKKTRKQK
ncbi:VeA protein [Colletotrichum higginsianum]|uniref:VeA protein n=2 Tax=Colletotrichum higginsianum TaxID=80884 RepID=H1V0F0_COLHI|nr:VeA protein [Colletotrichum higginsianum IMI 349063]OBR14295.1 VeA protein [Colletotrichum higginsianum IMI 349063]TID02085.1 Sexual development regulator VELC [Colletotrichum higginsianum]CCF33701.1 VeA protein [Colletotrichum higginsianum]